MLPVQLATLAILHQPALQHRPTLPVAALRRCERVKCALEEKVQTEFRDMMTEISLERNADLVELPVMFVSENSGNGTPSTFDFERWTQHRSQTRYYRLLLGILLGVTTRRITPVLIALLAFSSAVCVYAQAGLTNPNLVTVQVLQSLNPNPGSCHTAPSQR